MAQNITWRNTFVKVDPRNFPKIYFNVEEIRILDFYSKGHLYGIILSYEINYIVFAISFLQTHLTFDRSVPN